MNGHSYIKKRKKERKKKERSPFTLSGIELPGVLQYLRTGIKLQPIPMPGISVNQSSGLPRRSTLKNVLTVSEIFGTVIAGTETHTMNLPFPVNELHCTMEDH